MRKFATPSLIWLGDADWNDLVSGQEKKWAWPDVCSINDSYAMKNCHSYVHNLVGLFVVSPL